LTSWRHTSADIGRAHYCPSTQGRLKLSHVIFNLRRRLLLEMNASSVTIGLVVGVLQSKVCRLILIFARNHELHHRVKCLNIVQF